MLRVWSRTLVSLETCRKFLALLGLCLVSAFIVIHFGIQWEWSILMDEVTYLSSLSQAPSFWDAFEHALKIYWGWGRFYPVKYLGNIFLWRMLPLEPNVLHGFMFCLLLASVLLGVIAVTKERKTIWLLFALGCLVLQRPLLDVAALCSIGEGWLIFFFSLGLYFFPRSPLLYRVFFLCCALSKEIAILVFLSSACVHGLQFWWERTSVRLVYAGIDFAIFVSLAFIMMAAKNAGPYMGDYDPLSLSTIKPFLLALLKCSIGLVPLVYLSLVSARAGYDVKKLRALDCWQVPLLCLLFSLSYLFMASAKGTAGYLLIPSSFALFLFCLACLIISWEGIVQISYLRFSIFILLFLLVAGASLYRYQRFAAGVNEPTALLHSLLMTSSRRLIIVDGMETADQGNLLAKQQGSPGFMIERQDPELKKVLASFRGEVFYLNLSSYYGRLPAHTVEELGRSLGGWRKQFDRSVYHLYYGIR